MEKVPYVYFLKNKTTKLKYIGVRYGKKAHPNDFWVSYFTSSKLIHNLIEAFGVNDFKFKILKTFPDEYEALKFERVLIEKVLDRKDYINLHSNFVGNQDKDTYLANKMNQRKIASIIGYLSYRHGIGIHKFNKIEKAEIASKGGKIAAKLNKKLGRGMFDSKVREKQHETLRTKQKSAFYDPELKKEIASKGGKNGAFTKNYYEKHNLDEKDRIENQRKRGKKRRSKK